MNSFTVWEGSRVPLTVTQGDVTSISATIVMVERDSGFIIDKTANFETVEGETTKVADLTLDHEQTITGVYEYYILENFSGGEDPLVYPDPDNCSDEGCTLPTITVCELPGSDTSS